MFKGQERELQLTDLKSLAQHLCNQGTDNQSLRDEVISLVALSCKCYKYSCSRTQGPGLGGWMLSTALSQGSISWEVLTGPYCLRDCRGEERPEGKLEKLGAACAYLGPQGLAEYLFPRWFGLGWNWP